MTLDPEAFRRRYHICEGCGTYQTRSIRTCRKCGFVSSESSSELTAREIILMVLSSTRWMSVEEVQLEARTRGLKIGIANARRQAAILIDEGRVERAMQLRPEHGGRAVAVWRRIRRCAAAPSSVRVPSPTASSAPSTRTAL